MRLLWAINMNRMMLFENAKATVIEFKAIFPDVDAATSIVHQLDYLISLEKGIETNRNRLSEIIIGILTAREIEPRSEETAELLYLVVDEVKSMRKVSTPNA